MENQRLKFYFEINSRLKYLIAKIDQIKKVLQIYSTNNKSVPTATSSTRKIIGNNIFIFFTPKFANVLIDQQHGHR